MAPNDRDWQAVLGRIERVERQNRTLKLGMATILLLAGTAAVLAATQGSTVKAQKITVTDAGGTPRAVLAGRADGADFTLLTPAGTSGISLSVMGGVAALAVGDTGSGRIKIEAASDRSSLTLTTPGQSLAALDLKPGNSSLSLFNGGRQSALMALSPDGPHLLFSGGPNNAVIWQAP